MFAAFNLSGPLQLCVFVALQLTVAPNGCQGGVHSLFLTMGLSCVLGDMKACVHYMYQRVYCAG